MIKFPLSLLLEFFLLVLAGCGNKQETATRADRESADQHTAHLGTGTNTASAPALHSIRVVD